MSQLPSNLNDSAGGSTPEQLAEDVTVDVDFTAVMARSQSTIVSVAGMNYQANADMKQKLTDFGLPNSSDGAMT